MHAFHLAQINTGRLVAPVDDPRIASFMEQLDPVNRLAELSPGFVWRLQGDSGNATDVPYSDDPLMIVNMSVWESIEVLVNFTYRSKEHMATFRDRARWFEKMDKAHYCLWWVPDGHIPTVAEGRDQLEHCQVHGPTPYSFWFSQAFPAPATNPGRASL